MIKVCVVDSLGEQIGYISGTSAEVIDLNLKEGQVGIIFSPPHERSWWNFENSQWVTPLDKPGNNYYWDTSEKTWVLDLIAVKNNLLVQVMAERDAIEFGPFTYNGMVFDGDLNAQRRLSILVSAAKSSVAAGFSFTKDFTLADNSVVQLTAEDFIGIEMAKLLQVDAAFQEHRQKKAAIEAATTLEELESL